ncbi:MAG: DUF853 family protein [Oscillospiraceae bacterium]|nr:DUF853 family protein [Oscillospiraceae bacterium]
MDKDSLRTQTLALYHLRVFWQGIKSILAKPVRVLIVPFALLAAILFRLLWIAASPEIIRPIVSDITIPIIIISAAFSVYVLGAQKRSLDIYKDMLRAGIVNSAGEAPLLIARSKANDVETLTFLVTGIPLDVWRDNQAAIETALNLTIGTIRESSDKRTITIEAVSPSVAFADTIPFTTEMLPDRDTVFALGETITRQPVTIDFNSIPHALIGGATGSGKSTQLRLLIHQAVLHGADVYLVDLKGLDFIDIQQIQLVTEIENALSTIQTVENEMYARLNDFRAHGAKDYRDYCLKADPRKYKRIFLIIDEISMLLDHGTSKEAKARSTEAADSLAAIARQGRAVAVYLILSTQRPDAASLPGSIKSNINCRICGSADATLSTIVLGDGRANDLPKDQPGIFLYSDGKEDSIYKGYILSNTIERSENLDKR